jgi:hypothetical protein
VAKLKRERRPKVATGDVRAALRARFAAPAFAFFEEVGNATGFACGRHADGVVVSLWPSRGIWIQGLEIKVSRQDWLKELATPQKAEAVAKNCDFWSVVTGDESIIHAGELPERWGHLTLRGDKLVTVKEAVRNDGFQPTREFVAALLRRSHETIDKQLNAARAEGYQRGSAGADPMVLAQVQNELRDLGNEVAAFKQASGIDIKKHDGRRLGEAVAELARLNEGYDPDPDQCVASAARMLESSARQLKEFAERIEKKRAIGKATAAE